MIFALVYSVLVFVALPVFILALVSQWRRMRTTIAFFHPYCNAGGGGERVLWYMLRAFIDSRYKDQVWTYIIYTGDAENKETILRRAKERFNVELSDYPHVRIVRLRCRFLVEASTYPVFTLAGQLVGGFLLGLEALLRTGTPQVFIDTMGYPLTLPLFRWIAGSTTAAYVHYPFISSDMLTDVSNNVSAVHTRDWISSSSHLRHAKLVYYRFLARLYSWAGHYSCMMPFTNGLWTDGHIRALWKRDTILLHPPCPVKSIAKQIPTPSSEKLLDSGTLYIISIGQFRPEKNHRLQIETMHEIVKNTTLRNANGAIVQPMLMMFGSCRNEADMRRVDELKQYANEMEVGEYIHWMLNAPYETLQKELSEALIFLHTMRDEHFGIGVVEAMAAGTIAVAHNSGGPRMDIVLEGCGFLATTAKEYAARVQQVLAMGEQARKLMRKLALKQVYQFDEEYFMQKAKKYGDVLHQ